MDADIGFFVHANNKKKDILVLCEDPAQRLNDATITAETKCPISFKR